MSADAEHWREEAERLRRDLEAATTRLAEANKVIAGYDAVLRTIRNTADNYLRR